MLVEKPLAENAEPRPPTWSRPPKRADRVLMIDHTYCYTPAVGYIREAWLRERSATSCTWTPCGSTSDWSSPTSTFSGISHPHDLSILDFILPDGLDPIAVSASGSDPLGAGKACVGYLSMPLAVGGDRPCHRQLAVPDEDPANGDWRQQADVGLGRPQSAATHFDPRSRCRSRHPGADAAQQRAAITVSYRMGDIVVPALPEREALSSMADRVRSRDQ